MLWCKTKENKICTKDKIAPQQRRGQEKRVKEKVVIIWKNNFPYRSIVQFRCNETETTLSRKLNIVLCFSFWMNSHRVKVEIKYTEHYHDHFSHGAISKIFGKLRFLKRTQELRPVA